MVGLAQCGTTSARSLHHLASAQTQLTLAESKQRYPLHQRGSAGMVGEQGGFGDHQECGSLVDCLAQTSPVATPVAVWPPVGNPRWQLWCLEARHQSRTETLLQIGWC